MRQNLWDSGDMGDGDTVGMDAKDLYRSWIEHLWNGPSDADALRAAAARIVTADFVGHWPGRDVRGSERLAELIAEAKTMFSGLAFQIEVQPLVDADMVSARWNGAGTTVDGSVTRFFGNDILRVRDGRFCEYWVATGEV
ncbi:nuclear transport factor 2 family protein [Haloglycomyces albus]|uniref:nuclear transport factor 2 family protein n=1 Tax=Haloglycomyces albus TaxID=526067 RepID=UPI001B7FEE38|nr:nuclear transport factor 2 family protein [Haloglycomyces albus]